VFVDNGRPALAALRENVRALKLEAQTKILAVPVIRAAPALAGEDPFDLVFLDPPYAAIEEIPGLIAALEEQGAIAPRARVVVEHATSPAAPFLRGLLPLPSRVYGDTSVTIYSRESA